MLFKCWKEILFFSVIFVYYLFGLTTDMTWMSLGSDMFSYVGSAEYMEPAILAGYPLWVLVAWFFVKLPFNPFWSGALLSALCSVGISITIYMAVKHFTDNKWAPYVAALTYVGAFITWTQSTIPEVYTPTALVMVLGAYLTIRKRYYWSTFVFALGLGLHPIVTFSLFPCLFYVWYVKRDLRFIAKLMFFGSFGFLSFLQMELFTSSVDNGVAASGATVWDVLQTVGGLPVQPFMPTVSRGLECLVMLSVSIGFTLPLYFYVKRDKDVVLLGSIALLVFVLYFFSLLPQWITYLTFVVAFLSILAGYGLSRFPYQKAVPMFILIPIVLMVHNLYNYDVGRTVDPSPSTARQFYSLLDTLPPDTIIITSAWAHPGLLTEYYNLKEEGSIHLLRYAKVYWYERYADYISNLESKGIVVPPVFEPDDQPRMNENFEKWCLLVQENNLDREVYVAYLDKFDPEISFNLIPADDYRNSLNSCWTRGSKYNERGL